MSIVTLTTDFGYADYYTAQFKGDLLSLIPEVRLIDLSHQIPSYNIVSGAYALKQTYRHFPNDTVHILRVNEQGIGSERVMLAFYQQQYFLAPDNGILSLVFSEAPQWIYAVDYLKLRARNANMLYARACQELFQGSDLHSFLKDPGEYKTLSEFLVIKHDDSLRGMVVMVDHFGNLITNIHVNDIRPYHNRFEYMMVLYRDKERITQISEYYNEVPLGERLARFNDEGYLEIAMNQGSAASMLGIKYGDYVNIHFS
jgi:S-adenosyl-L-methionine hydrolase (adenosine-forming)